MPTNLNIEMYQDNTIILLGIGQETEILFELFKTNGINIAYICENKPSIDKKLENIPVISPPQLKQLAKSKNNQNSGEIVVQIAVRKVNDNTIKQLNSIGIHSIISFNDAMKIFNYTTLKPEISPEHAEFDARNKRYTDSLRGLNNEKFPLLRPEDMPEHAKELVKKLEYLKQSYLAGENFYIDKEKTMLLQDFCSRGYMNGVRRIGGYQEHLVGQELNLGFTFKTNIQKAISDVSALSNYLKEINIPFLYMQLPCKVSPSGAELVEGLTNVSNEKANQFIEGILQNGVNVLDYRQYMIDNNINYLDSFFKTDHHWKSEVAFNACKVLCEELEVLVGLNTCKEKLDISNYDKILYKKIFLGPHGKQSGVLYSGIDDFNLILPKYETNYTWIAPIEGFVKKGNAIETLLYPLKLFWEFRFEHNLIRPFGVYSLIHYGRTIIKNNEINQKLKVLLLNDSFSNPLASFLASQIYELHVLDLRGNKKDLLGVIEEIKPDIVIMAYTTFTFNVHPLMTDVNPNNYVNF